MKSVVIAAVLATLATHAYGKGPIAWTRGELHAAEAALAELLAVPAEKRDASAIAWAEAKVISTRHVLSGMEVAVQRYHQEHGIDRWQLGDKVRSPLLTSQFLGDWGLEWWGAEGRTYGQPEYSFGIWDHKINLGLATVEITLHESARDALEQVLIGGALPAPPPLRGVGDVGFSRDPEEYTFVRDNCLIEVIVRRGHGPAADLAQRLDAMILDSPRAEDPAHPVVTLEPGLESRLMPKVKRTLPIPPSPVAIPSPLLPPPAAPSPSRP